MLLKAEGIEADYVDLPDGILGRTLFSANGDVQVELSRALSELAHVDKVARRRLRTTIAHECGHIACHRQLFVQDTASLSLFAPDLAPTSPHAAPSMLCRGECIGASYSGEWWEYQANQCMAALLFPRTHLSAYVRELFEAAGYPSGDACLERGGGEQLVRQIADEYDVSQTASLYRLQTLGFFPKDSQARLRLVD